MLVESHTDIWERRIWPIAGQALLQVCYVKPCKLPAAFSLALDVLTTSASAAEMPLPHIFLITSFPCILPVSSLNTTLIRCTEINLRETNSGHADDVMLRLLGNKAPCYQHFCCWEPSVLPFSGGHNGK